jgi:hypothetical protein
VPVDGVNQTVDYRNVLALLQGTVVMVSMIQCHMNKKEAHTSLKNTRALILNANEDSFAAFV